MSADALVLDLLAHPEAVAQVRHRVREYLGVPCPDVQLCVSELLTNVIDHVGEGVPVVLRLSRTRDHVRLEVTDPEPRAWLAPRRPGEAEEGGRGLLLLDAVSLRWGVEQGLGGKTVWCELHEGAYDSVSGRAVQLVASQGRRCSS
ncbi:ATP-binding protein [Streptomyces sp. enrichment culture]|uniref:ATP-binding protein n=1 Tax=Streptomyces sp. enrichment culture TaxID=1795815 RepID=UPI003F57711C